MVYITIKDLQDELGRDKLTELTDLDRVGVEDRDRASRAIEYAEGTFNMYARTRYVVPVAVDATVKGICINLAVFHFYKNSLVAEGAYEVRLQAHDRAIRKLEGVARGLVELNATRLSTPSAASAAPEFPGSQWVPDDQQQLVRRHG